MLDQIKGSLKSISQVLIFGGTISIAAAVGFILYRQLYKSNTDAVKPNVAPAEMIRSDLQRLSQALNAEKDLISVINSVKKAMPDGQKINFQAIKAIYEGQFQLSRSESHDLIRQNRNERRLAINDLRSYFDHVNTYEQTLEQIHNNHLNAILAHFKINKSHWMDLVEEAAINQKDQWDQVLVQTEASQMQSLRSKDQPTLRVSKLKEILQFKAGKLADRIQEFKETFKLVEPSILFIVIQFWADDVVYQKYKIQPEDINSSILQLSPDQRLELQQSENKINTLIESLIVGNDMIEF